MSNLSPQGGLNRTLIRSLSPVAIYEYTPGRPLEQGECPHVSKTPRGGSSVGPGLFERSAGRCHTLGLQLHALDASTERDVDRAFATLAQPRTSALVIGNDPFFNSRSEHLAAFAATKRIYLLTTI